MRKFFMTAFVLASMVVFASSALALEKTSKRLTDERGDNWGAANTVTLAYYNNCTGWVWVWSGWSPGEEMGVCYDASGCTNAVLNTTWALTFSPAPSGYGFTGTVSIEDACDCTGSTLAAQPFLPAASGWNAFAWGVPVPSNFLVKVTWAAASGFTNGTGLASDHPFNGPTGPTSCGTCFPTTRTSNSLYYGIGGSACPGTTLSDGLCDIEFMMEAALKCAVSVEDASWGQIKNLYQ